MIDETIPAALDGERLDRIVALSTGCTRAEAAALVRDGGAELDGCVVTVGKQRVRAGQQMRIDPRLIPRAVGPQPDPTVEVPVVYEDAAVIVVDKPAGLVVHPGSGRPDGTLVNGLLARYPELAGVGEEHRPGIVHRLDAGTSGLMVVARTAAAATALVDALSRRLVRRVYRTLVWGHLAHANGVIEAPIGRDPRLAQRMAVVVDGKPARTEYAVDDCFDVVRGPDGETPLDTALLTCRLETGRTHQIRVHLSAAGHPVVGDPTYGGVRPGLQLDRPFLHAAELSFAHPTDGTMLSVVSPLPADLVAVLDRLGRGP